MGRRKRKKVKATRREVIHSTRNRPDVPSEIMWLARLVVRRQHGKFTVSTCDDRGPKTLHFRFRDEVYPYYSAEFVNRCNEHRYDTVSDIHGNVWVDPEQKEF
jgi:hypothetical protein